MSSVPDSSKWLFVLLLCECSFAVETGQQVHPPDDGGKQNWKDLNGRSIHAYFKRMEAGKVVVADKLGREAALPVNKLSQESKRQAERFAAVIGVFQPVGAQLSGKGNPISDLRSQLKRSQTIGGNHFDMGSPEHEPGRDDDEALRKVRLSPFEMKATEVTWTEWNTVRNLAIINGYVDISPGGNGTPGFDADLNPVVGITWWDAVKWCNLKSQLEGKTVAYKTKDGSVFKHKTCEVRVDWKSDGYRLPTEAEWEYACRGGRSSTWEFHTGAIRETGSGFDRSMDQAGWYAFNSKGGPNPVALKSANHLKLHDMHGNAAEWCWDFLGDFDPDDVVDPKGPTEGGQRVIRGGSWNDPARSCRAAARGGFSPEASPDRSVGFRIVRAR